MVKFENIRVSGEYIYALETDLLSGESCKIKLHISKEEYECEGNLSSNYMVKALWCLQRRLRENKKLNSVEVMSWG